MLNDWQTQALHLPAPLTRRCTASSSQLHLRPLKRLVRPYPRQPINYEHAIRHGVSKLAPRVFASSSGRRCAHARSRCREFARNDDERCTRAHSSETRAERRGETSIFSGGRLTQVIGSGSRELLIGSRGPGFRGPWIERGSDLVVDPSPIRFFIFVRP